MIRLYALLWAIALPFVALFAALHPRLRGAWAERLALRAPPVEPGAVWIHAASVGEGRVAEALFEAMRAQMGPDRPVFFRTAFTDTGLATARGHDALAALPLDHPGAIRRWVARLRPRVLVLVEAELWPGLLLACRDCGVPVVVAAARPGRGTERLRRWMPGLLNEVQGWLAVSATAAAGLRHWGLDGVETVGDIKADAPQRKGSLRFSRPLLVAGSTRDGDEAALLAARGAVADLQLLLAPRHPERFGEVSALLDRSGLRWSRRSALDERVPPELEVVMLDTVGELAGCYEAAELAFVGGSFDARVGAHSPTEALAAGVPVAHGPEIWANAASFSPDRCVRAPSREELGPALARARGLGRVTPAQGEAAALAAERALEMALPAAPPERPYRPALAPLAALWRVRPRREARGPNPLPVIAVGNLVSGGSGKTQVVRFLLERLRERRPWVVSRGYGRLGGPGLRDASQRSDADWLGDELAMLHAAGWPVLSSPDRVAGVAEAARRGAGLVILDDAMQQTQVKPDLLIAVVDARHPLGGGVIPMGEAREGPEALGRAGLVWLFGDEEPELLRPHRRGALVKAEVAPLAPDLPAQEVVAFAGIARPGRFLEQLVAMKLRVAAWRAFPDHHRFTARELAALRALAGGRPLVCTEKDKARLPADFPCHALRVELRLREGEAALQAALDRVLA